MKVLIAHHADITRQVFAAYCGRLAYADCLGVKSAKDAYRELDTHEYDLVIIRFEWIHNSKLEWLSRLPSSNIRVVAVTTDFSKKHEQWCKRMGIFSYIQLPMSFNLFRKLLQANPIDDFHQPNT